MRFVAIFLSLVMLVTLTYQFFIEGKAIQNKDKIVKITELVIPAYISDTPLEVERVWQQLKAKRIKAEQPVEVKSDKSLKNKDVLTLGKSKYALYGIFNSSKNGVVEGINKRQSGSTAKAFILIKALVNEDKSAEASILKVMQGEELSEGITLVGVSTNTISFKQGDEQIEFKLFETIKQ
jgi:hypothetical protein